MQLFLAALSRGELQYNLFGPCERCSSFKVSCNKLLGCDRCFKAGTCCIPTSYEIISRAKRLNRHILGGDFIHNDHVKYQLGLQASVYGCKSVLHRTEMKDVFGRIVDCTGNNRFSVSIPTIGILSLLPEELKEYVGDHDAFKIEWMEGGTYMCAMSKSYGDNFITENGILKVSRQYKIAPKLVDMVGLNDFDMAYKMWCESVFNPHTSVTYTGSGFWSLDRRLCYTTVRMMSSIIKYDYIITVTTVGRGKVYTFK